MSETLDSETNPPVDPGHPDSASTRPVRRATRGDRRAISRVIGRAFFDDPIAIHLFPDLESRERGFGAFAELAMDQFAGAGETWVTDPIEGAAIWQAPHPPRLGFWRQIGMALRLYRVTRHGYARAIRLSETIEQFHAPQPHWYLAILGVDPDAQGRGLGSALLEPMLTRCDEEGIPAYLESSKETNLPFYRRHGFEVRNEVRIPDGPLIWTMVRSPG